MVSNIPINIPIRSLANPRRGKVVAGRRRRGPRHPRNGARPARIHIAKRRPLGPRAGAGGVGAKPVHRSTRERRGDRARRRRNGAGGPARSREPGRRHALIIGPARGLGLDGRNQERRNSERDQAAKANGFHGSELLWRLDAAKPSSHSLYHYSGVFSRRSIPRGPLNFAPRAVRPFIVFWVRSSPPRSLDGPRKSSSNL